MTRPATPCEKRFRTAAPRKLFETLWRYLDTLYPYEYQKAMGRYRYEAALTLLPHQRRAQIETDLPQMAHDLGLQVTVEGFPNTTDTFVLIHLQGNVKLIVCYVRNKGDAVRYALARAGMAEESNQPYLLPPPVQQIVSGPQALFTIFAHSPDAKDVGRFAGGEFIFPSPDARTSLGRLSLRTEMERIQLQDAEAAVSVERKVEIKVKKGGNVS